MDMNWGDRITMLMTKWHKLTHGYNPLEVGVMADWRSGLPPSYSAYLYPKHGGTDRAYFNTVQEAQEWLVERLQNKLEEEFRRQVAQQAAEEEKEE